MLGIRIDRAKRRRWFLWLLLFFLAANLTGTVRQVGFVGDKVVGIPFPFATWGTTFGDFFYLEWLLANLLVAVLVSSTLSWLLALKRSDGRGLEGKDRIPPRGGGEGAPDNKPSP